MDLGGTAGERKIEKQPPDIAIEKMRAPFCVKLENSVVLIKLT